MRGAGKTAHAPGARPGDPERGDGLWFEAAKRAHGERTRLGTFGAASECRRLDPAGEGAAIAAKYTEERDP